MQIFEEAEYSGYFSSRLKGSAAGIAVLETDADIREARRFADAFILGRGSNVIPTSTQLDRWLIVLGGEFKRVEGDWDSGKLQVGAAVPLPVLANQACRQGWAGLELLGGIPGTVAGGLVMNAGVGDRGKVAFGPLVEEVEVADPDSGELRWEVLDTAALGYRSSPFLERKCLITRLRLQLRQRAPSELLLKHYVEARAWRKQHQPLNLPSWGSTFVNPPGDYAGRLIDQCGLKGEREGDLEVSPLQANFIVNHGEGTGPEALRLIERIQQQVFAQTGIRLSREVRYLN